MKGTPLVGSPGVSRRRFVQGLATVTAAAALPFPLRSALAAPNPASLLSGRDFALEIGPVAANMTGRSRMAVGVNG
jgi:TAT (twin-arginine translocation) pathway signal sequence